MGNLYSVINVAMIYYDIDGRVPFKAINKSNHFYRHVVNTGMPTKFN